MEVDRLHVETNPAAQDIQFLEDRINEYNKAETGIYDAKLLAIFLHRENNEMIAGIFGWTWGGCCEIQYLWVHQDRRREGYGKKLLLAAEQEAEARGCHQVVLDTHSFQALEFYGKLGYEIIGWHDDYPHGYRKYYLRKRLA